jgi:hypothetical protein
MRDEKGKYYKNLNLLELEVETLITELEFEIYEIVELNNIKQDKAEKYVEHLYEFDEKIKNGIYDLKEKVLKNINKKIN